MLDKLINYITYMITGIDASSMNLNEFFVWWNTTVRVHSMVYTTLDVTIVVLGVIAVALMAYLIVSSIKSNRSEEEKA